MNDNSREMVENLNHNLFENDIIEGKVNYELNLFISFKENYRFF